MSERQILPVAGYWRSKGDGTRMWINPHLRCYGGETIAAARERFDRRWPRSRVCETCDGTGWVFREPPEDTTRCKLCPTCDGQGRTWHA